MEDILKQGLSQDESKRKIASIQKVKSITPIKGADRIELARVLGWNVVVKKGEFSVGDKCVYFEIDSLLPEKEEFSFIGSVKVNPITRMTGNEERGYRLRTQKLRGQISQGLLFSFKNLPVPNNMLKDDFLNLLDSFDVDTNVSELIGVVKWEVPESKSNFGMTSAPFPSEYVSKTDEERIQNEPIDFFEIKREPYFISTKIDGTSITVIKKENEIIYATRNTTLNDDNLIKDFLEKTGSLEKIKNYSSDVIFQSEFYGDSVQGNRLGIIGNRMATFNVIKDGKRLGLLGMLKFIDEVDLELPPIIELGTADAKEIEKIERMINKINSKRKKIDMTKSKRELEPAPIILLNVLNVNFNYTAEELLNMADGLKYLTNGSYQEGIVIRPLYDTDQWAPLSFKAISNKFLLKYD